MLAKTGWQLHRERCIPSWIFVLHPYLAWAKTLGTWGSIRRCRVPYATSQDAAWPSHWRGLAAQSTQCTLQSSPKSRTCSLLQEVEDFEVPRSTRQKHPNLNLKISVIFPKYLHVRRLQPRKIGFLGSVVIQVGDKHHCQKILNEYPHTIDELWPLNIFSYFLCEDTSVE